VYVDAWDTHTCVTDFVLLVEGIGGGYYSHGMAAQINGRVEHSTAQHVLPVRNLWLRRIQTSSHGL